MAVVNAKQAYRSAVSARKTAQAAMDAFYASAVTSVKQALGPTNAGQLPSLGVELPAPRKEASPATKVIAKAKADATREARGTMGKKQRQAITATPGATVQVAGLATPSGVSASASTSSSVSSPSNPTPSHGAATPTTGAATPPAAS